MNISLKFKEKKIIALIIVLLLVVTSSIGYIMIKPPSVQDVFEKVQSYEADDVNAYLENVYPEDGGFLGLFKEKNKNSKAEVLFLMIKELDKNFKSTYGRSIEDYSAVKITKVDISYGSYSSDYRDINITVTNEGTTSVNYMKINLYYKDTDGNIIKSEWTNDSSEIKPGASQVITKTTKQDGWHSVSTEIAEIR